MHRFTRPDEQRSMSIHPDTTPIAPKPQALRGLPYLLLLFLVVSATGCASKSHEAAPTEAPATPAKKRRSEEVLYQAILQELEARGHKIATSSPRFFTASTHYDTLSARLRSRRVVRILMLPQGGALQVKVAMERDEGAPGAPRWAPVTDGALAQRAKGEEMELARAIEKRFHQMR